MYVPKYYMITDQEKALAFIQSVGFALVTGIIEGRISASHLPLEVRLSDEGAIILTGHLSRANPLSLCFDGKQELMIVFLGAHAPISPTWYNHPNVPTWNYKSAHLYGVGQLTDPQTTKEELAKLVDKYERLNKTDLQFESMDKQVIAQDFKGLSGFEIKVHHFDVAFKLSQNRDEENLVSIIQNLEKLGGQSAALAQEMRDFYNLL